MYEISVDESFAAAHNLRNYHGKCEDLHGHNYKVRVVLTGKELDATGLLYDFVHLKRVIQEVIRVARSQVSERASAIRHFESFGGKHRAAHLRPDGKAASAGAERGGHRQRHGMGDGHERGYISGVGSAKQEFRG